MKNPLLFVTVCTMSLCACLVAEYIDADSIREHFAVQGGTALWAVCSWLYRISFLLHGAFLYRVLCLSCAASVYFPKFSVVAGFLSLCFCFSLPALSLFWTGVFGVVSLILAAALKKHADISVFSGTPSLVICALNVFTVVF